jgi:hypothetical protein
MSIIKLFFVQIVRQIFDVQKLMLLEMHKQKISEKAASKNFFPHQP